MANQAPLNDTSDGRPTSEGGAQIIIELATLADLQAKLAMLDFRESVRAARLPLIVTAASCVLMIGGVPVALFGTAAIVTTRLGVDPDTSLLLTAAVALGVAVMGIGTGWVWLRRSSIGFVRSSEELRRNIAWARALLHGPGQKHPSGH